MLEFSITDSSELPPLQNSTMSHIRRLLAALIIASLAAAPAHAKTKLDWNPERTSVFVVGLLQWEHADIWSSFPACMKDRRDQHYGP